MKTKTAEGSFTQNTTSPLYKFIESETNTLLPTIRTYIWKAGIAHNKEQLKEMAEELVQDVVEVALRQPEHFDNQRVPKAWLLRIAANLVRQRQQKYFTEQKREPLIRDKYSKDQEYLSDGELFDRLAETSQENSLEDNYVANEQAEKILQLVSPKNREILRLALVVGLDGKELAAQLGRKPSTARSDLHRALRELRTAWFAQKERQ